MATPKPVVTIGDNNALPNPEAENKVNTLPGKTKAFVAKHTLKTIDKTGAAKNQFTADSTKKDESKLASYRAGKDAQVYEEVELEEASIKLNFGKWQVMHKGKPVATYVAKYEAQDHAKQINADNPKKAKVAEEVDQIAEEEELDKATRDKLSINKIKRDAQVARNGIARKPREGLAAYITRVQKHKAKMQKEEVEQIDEVSMDLAKTVAKKRDARGDAFRNKAGIMSHGSDAAKSAMDNAKKNWNKADKTKAIIAKRQANEEVEQIDEVSASDIANAGRPQVARGGNAKAHALAKASETAQEKSKVSLKKAPWEQKEEVDLGEDKMTKTDIKQRENFVKGMKKNAQSFKDKYGDRWKSVMYAVATKNAMKEATILPDNFSDRATPTPNKRAYAVDKANSEKKPVTLKKAPWEQKEEAEQIGENIRNVGDRMLKFLATTDTTHPDYSRQEVKDEHNKRMKWDPIYQKTKALYSKEEVDLGESNDGRRLRDELKSEGKHEEAGAVAHKHGLGRSYGPHFGMRSTKYSAETAFHKGYDKAALATKKTNESVEQIDEISRDTARSYIRKAMAHKTTGETPKKDRSAGVEMAGKKAYEIGGKAKVKATSEDVELELLNKLYESLNESNQKIMAIMLEDGRENELLTFAMERFNGDL